MARTAKWILALALVAGLGQTARAGLIPGAVSVTPDGSNFRFTYSIVLPSDYTLKPGDYFTVYDFNGYVAGMNTQPAGWNFHSGMSGTTPAHINPTDSTSIPNLTWVYSGARIVGGANLGEFSAESQFGGQKDGDFTSRDFSTLLGRTVGNITTTEVPDQGSGAKLTETPEPATLVLIGAALPLLGLYRLTRRRS